MFCQITKKLGNFFLGSPGLFNDWLITLALLILHIPDHRDCILALAKIMLKLEKNIKNHKELLGSEAFRSLLATSYNIKNNNNKTKPGERIFGFSSYHFMCNLNKDTSALWTLVSWSAKQCFCRTPFSYKTTQLRIFNRKAIT